MKVLVDTCIWSLALRRRTDSSSDIVMELENLIKDSRAHLIGPIRQEILSGLRSGKQFNTLRNYLKSFPDVTIITEDYEKAADFFNVCRAKGIQGSNTDFLMCSIAERIKSSIFTIDKDFRLFSSHIQIHLHEMHRG